MRRLCKVLEVHPNSFHAWRQKPEGKRAKEDKRLLASIKESLLESSSVYGYRKVCDDLREDSEPCGVNHLHRLIRCAGIRPYTGYTKRKSKTRRCAIAGGAESPAAPV